MKRHTKRLLFWAPRIIGILYAVFISVFALDVFREGYAPGRTILALLMHLIPTALIIFVLVISWRWEWLGALIFAAGGSYYAFTNLNHLGWILTISGPLFVMAVLFLLNWLYSREIQSGR